MNIDTRDLGITLAGSTILSHLDLHLEPGRMVALTGPSGCGKSTLLACLGLIQRPTTGKVLVDGVDTTSWKDRERTRFWGEHAAFIYQDYGIIEEESARYNVTLRRGYGAVADAALASVGLANKAKATAATLSGGEKQRLGIARAIYKESSVIYADEPTASLDARNRATVTSLLRERAQAGALVLIATHDEALAGLCDQQISLA
ncbi:ABC transporter ATP-binding protein [Corynebacterium oculi]|uniref:Cell division ATP-binding protein FtsE n=1 Tax=Corynebacterium oculi TaxID=1544416 RepID=A0A0Q1DTZ2_9CORY|nr:ATP-binding cassette domain-containing protein [Corynebacterium oculi]KQB83563.1 Cell division ATP-binding protein FtsE [Corynebacterium oculi]